MSTAEGTITNEFARTALRAARAAGEIIRARGDTSFRVDRKGITDLVTEVDLAAEKEIIGILSSSFPEHRIMAEESGREDRESDYIWLIDPIDGTTNFVHGYPFYSVSVALEYRSEVILGIVYDPLRDELFRAVRGQGADLNGDALAVSSVDSISDALLATGFPYDRDQRGRALSIASGLLPRIQGLRRDGSAALDLAYVAAARLDGFWEFGLKPWDTAAGRLLVEEAGGRVTDFSGGEFSIRRGSVVATNGRIHTDLVALLN